MPGASCQQDSLYSFVNLEDRIPHDHLIRKVRRLVDAALEKFDGVFADICPEQGRPSTPPAHLMRAVLLQLLFSSPQ